MNVHHVPCLVVPHLHVRGDIARDPEMHHDVFGREEGCGEIVVTVQHQHAQIRVLDQRIGEIDA